MIDTVIQWMSNALETVKLISILDIIDICIVAYVVYRILLFIRRSRSGQVAKAILIIIIALGVASTLRLRVVNFILRNAVELGLISLVIIFQPDAGTGGQRKGQGAVRGRNGRCRCARSNRRNSEGVYLHVQGQGRGTDGL